MAQSGKKIVLITGASSGIGAEIARAFAKQGASLSLTGRNKENLSKVSKECKDLGAGNTVEIIADLSEKEGIKKVVKETTDVYDKLDVLVNNAGLVFSGNTENTSFDDYTTMCNVHLRAPFFLTQKFIPFLEKVKGNVINISSLFSQTQMTQYIVYCMSKAGLDHFTKTAALELSAKGIRVNAVGPGSVYTNLARDLNLGMGVDEIYAKTAPLHPLGKRNVKADEIADAVLFLASDAAKMITGVCLNVDGGRVLTGQ